MNKEKNLKLGMGMLQYLKQRKHFQTNNHWTTTTISLYDSSPFLITLASDFPLGLELLLRVVQVLVSSVDLEVTLP